MKELSREEKLERSIFKTAEEHESRKWSRVKRTFFVLSGAIYLAAFMFGDINGTKEYLMWLMAAPVMAGFVMLIAWAVLSHIINGAMQDRAEIAKLEGRLYEMKYGKYE